MEKSARMYDSTSCVLVDRMDIGRAVKKVGEMITEDYQDKEPVLVCILKGASVFFSDLIREIDLPLVVDFIACSSYGEGTESSGEIQIRKDLETDVAGRDVLIVEDIMDTGYTLDVIHRMLEERGASSDRIVTLLDKPARRKVDLKADYFCFTIPDEFVVGYGLDYGEKYRNLPDICVLKPEVYRKA